MAKRLQTIVGAVYTLTHRYTSPAHTKVLLSCLQRTDSQKKKKHCSNCSFFLPTCFLLKSCEISFFPTPLQQCWGMPFLHHISLSVCSIFRTFTITQGTVKTQLHLGSTLAHTLGNNTGYKHNTVLPLRLQVPG